MIWFQNPEFSPAEKQTDPQNIYIVLSVPSCSFAWSSCALLYTLGCGGTSAWLNEKEDRVLKCHFKLDALHQLQLQMASGNNIVSIVFTPFFIIIYHVFLISFFFGLFLYCKCFILWYYCFPESILLRTRLHRPSNWPTCAFLLDCQSLAVSRFLFFLFLFSLVTFFYLQIVGICLIWYTEMLCGTAIILHWTSQTHSSLLFGKEQTCWIKKNFKKWKLHQTSDDRTEKSIEYTCDGSCIVLSLTTVVWTEMSEYRCIYGGKQYSTWYFFFLFFYVLL